MVRALLAAALAAATVLGSVAVPTAGASQQAPGGSPFGAVDRIVATGTEVYVEGWAIDPDVPLTPIVVHVWRVGDSAPLGGFVADGARPDVDRAFAGVGPTHGFSVTLPAALPGGSQTLCVFAINVGAGDNAALGCQQVTTLSDPNPIGALDIVEVSADGAWLRTTGWTFDIDTPAPIVAHVWRVGDAAPLTGVVADLDRPDVAAAFPGYGRTHGFDTTVRVDLPDGFHTICAFGLNVLQGDRNSVLGCRVIRVGQLVTLAFGGDVHFEGFVRNRLLSNPTGLLAPIAPILSSADLAIVNLETTVTSRGFPDPKRFTFRAPEVAFDALRAAGVDVVSLANNHAADFGLVSLVDTLGAASRAGIGVVGAGMNEPQAYAPYVLSADRFDVAVLGGSDVLDYYAIQQWVARGERPGVASAKPGDLPRLLFAVREAAANHDVVAVMMHWGVENVRCPTGRQLCLSDQLIAAGADIVVGGHSHRTQGGGWKHGAVVHYGLGNFVWYATSGPATQTGVFEVTVGAEGPVGYRWRPAVISGGVPVPVPVDDWPGLRACTDLQP